MKTPSDIDKIIIVEHFVEQELWNLFAVMCHILLLSVALILIRLWQWSFQLGQHFKNMSSHDKTS